MMWSDECKYITENLDNGEFEDVHIITLCIYSTVCISLHQAQIFKSFETYNKFNHQKTNKQTKSHQNN